MWPQFTSMLPLWQWLALLAVPPLLVLLYFLKLRRHPVLVPSTYLWRKSIEDLHVNSLWQRLRKNLLLLMQLVMLLLLMFALLRPSWQGSKLSGDRFIFLVDNSASMTATDVLPTRLEEAKRRAGELIEQMESGDVAMIVSFADQARVQQSFTDNRAELRRRLEAIEPTARSTSLAEALHVASGLANPGRSATDFRDTQVAEALPATLFIFSDGKFPDVKDFSLGNLEPVFVPIGQSGAANVGIVSLATGREDITSGQLEAFARLENFGAADATVDLSLLLDGELIDADQVEVPAGESRGVVFQLADLTSGVLELRTSAPGDSLALDNTAWATIDAAYRARVLLVTPGNEPLELALNTGRARQLAYVLQHSPDYLASEEYRRAALSGMYDLVVYDRCRPEQPPQANTLYIDALPPGEGWKFGATVEVPQIVDVERAHPLMQLLELGDVLVAEGQPITPPQGATVLIESGSGPLMAIAPRDAFEDAALGLALIGDDGPRTNWPVRPSFPVLVYNVLDYLGGRRQHGDAGQVRPGQSVSLRLQTDADSLRVQPPQGPAVEVARGPLNEFRFSETDLPGIYPVHDKGEAVAQIAVNLFDALESRIAPRTKDTVRIGHVEVVGQRSWEPARRDIWKLLLVAALAVVLGEWYIYNRRVYV